jgi:YHS domain-containing protein
MKKNQWIAAAIIPTSVFVLAAAMTSGCAPLASPSASPSTMNEISSDAPSLKSGDSALEHGHKSGEHGGIMISLGRDSYHVEAVVDTTGWIRLYTLGKDETRVIDVESQTLKGFVKAEGDSQAESISFEPQPQEGDTDKRTSLFVGKLPEELVGRRLDVTIPNIRIDGERFRLGFQSGQESHGDTSEMPDKLSDGEDKELYLTIGGRYTAADIAANGNMTAMQKFKGIKSSHNMNPAPGDRTCPISGTKANPKFTWVIDGKPYLFCCPPCVDEFVKMAKGSNDPLPAPESYVK